MNGYETLIVLLIAVVVVVVLQSNPNQQKTVIGSTVSSLTQPRAPDIGTVGTVLQPSSNVPSHFSITMLFTLVTGLTMFPTVRNIVSSRTKTAQCILIY